ncbi:MAG TPA: tryptophan 2,3-dioxygenase family protein [Acidobacteriaceae bacterium]|jgi:tryptophan 2,3-dioxygenase|nr:tryptophan 2,3-dioxygenase family protein [Acidobacteriaceae bacterium]
MSQRDLEPGIVTDFADRLSYAKYLCLEGLLAQQQPLSKPVHHDEMLFIIQHQVSELWIKLLIHEIRAAMAHVRADQLDPCFKILSRVKLIQMQLFDQWAVLETLTPSEYMEFRSVLGNSSGFQSHQYRTLELLLGNKNRAALRVFAHDPTIHDELTKVLEAPSLYDEFLLHLKRRGLAVPEACVQRDWALPHEESAALVEVFRGIYQDPRQYWDAYEMCEKLVDVEEYFQLWRFRHMKTVERIIGFRPGTGGSSGVGFLRKALELTFFPELFSVRTGLRQK